MTGDTTFMLGHFRKAKALADMLKWRWTASITDFTPDDPRYGIPPGLDEGDGFIAFYWTYGDKPYEAMQLEHMYSCASNVWRGFLEIGRMWSAVGAAAGRSDVAAHGAELLAVALAFRCAARARRAPSRSPSARDPRPSFESS